MSNEKEYICTVNGVVGRMGKVIGMCSCIGCGSNECHYSGDCEHKVEKQPDQEGESDE